jgi:hypothetical protein
MRTIMNSKPNVLYTREYPYVEKNHDLKIEIVDFQKSDKNYILQIGLTNLEKDNYRIFSKGAYLTLIISVSNEYSRPIHMHDVNWKLYERPTFETLKYADIWLPGDNFYLIRHIAYPEINLLKVILGKMNFNEIAF